MTEAGRQVCYSSCQKKFNEQVDTRFQNFAKKFKEDFSGDNMVSILSTRDEAMEQFYERKAESGKDTESGSPDI